MSFRIVVSKTGFNALTETNPDNLVFSSEYNTLKYSISGSLSINVSASANTFYVQRNSVSHGLGFLPFHVTYANQPKSMTGYSPVGVTFSWIDDGVGTTWYRHLRSWVTSTHLWVAAEGLREMASESYTATFYYKIYRNRLDI